MKNTIIKLLSLLLVLLLILSASTTFFAETIFTSGDYSYTLMNDNNISLYDWAGGSDTLTIPNSLDYLYVSEIRNRCFISRDDFTSLNLGQADHLNRIGLSAFKDSAISGELRIPPQVKVIASSAFENCDGIEVLYYDAMANVVSSQCFYDCDSLKEVYLTDGVTSIESHAFSNCDSLELVRIPRSVNTISTTSFSDCPNLVIYCYTDSYAHSFAEDNGIEYVLIDAPMPTEPATEPVTEPVTEATEATEPPTTPVEVSFILGDADNSGNVDIVDATFAQRYVTRSEIPAEILSGMDLRADIDSSGEVESTDVTFIMRHIIRLNVPYPIGELITV